MELETLDPRHAQGVGNVVGRHRRFRQIEQTVNLAHRAIDAPSSPCRPIAGQTFRPRQAFLLAVFSVITEISDDNVRNVKPMIFRRIENMIYGLA